MINKKTLKNYFRVAREIGDNASYNGYENYLGEIEEYKGYVSIKNSTLHFLEPTDYGVKFIGENLNGEVIINALQEMDPDICTYKIVMDIPESKEIEEELKDYFSYELEEYENLDLFKEDYSYEIIEFYVRYGYIDLVLENSDYCIGSVGYSPFSYFMACKSIDKNFVSDMWDGMNWYDVKIVDTKGDIVERLINVYAPELGDISQMYYDKEEYKEVFDLDY